jgi:hypothetical protein
MNRVDPFFGIERQPLITSSGIPVDKEALVREDTGTVLGIISPGYKVVSNNDVSDLFDRALENYPVAKVTDHLDSIGKRWKRRIVFDKDELSYDVDGRGDNVGVMIEIHNGYDARTAWGFNVLGYRWICQNGMVMGKKKLFSESYSHFNDDIQRLLNSFQMKFELFNQTALTWSDWTKESFNRHDFKGYIESKIKDDNRGQSGYISRKIAEGIVAQYDPIMNKYKMDENKWGAFNVLTYISTHETKARKGSNVFSNRYKTVNRLADDFYSFEKAA